jgi:hypothetical protein
MKTKQIAKSIQLTPKKNNLALRINEISFKDPSKLIKKNFIELKTTGLVKVMSL